MTKLEQIKAVEAALKSAYEVQVNLGCGCCAGLGADEALSEALETLDELLPPLLAELRMEYEP